MLFAMQDLSFTHCFEEIYKNKLLPFQDMNANFLSKELRLKPGKVLSL